MCNVSVALSRGSESLPPAPTHGSVSKLSLKGACVAFFHSDALGTFSDGDLEQPQVPP